LGILDKGVEQLPKIRFDCGREDPLIEHNRALRQVLEKRNIPHVYEEFDGGYGWAYWQENITDTLQYFNNSI